MDVKYIINADKSGKINFIGIRKDNGYLTIERIVNKEISNEYIEQLKEINRKYGGDFFIAVNNRKVKYVKSSFFEEKLRKAYGKENEKELYVVFGKNKDDYENNRVDLDYVLEEVNNNSKGDNIAKRIVSAATDLRLNSLIAGDIILEGRIKFIHIVDKNNEYVNDEYSSKIENNIAKVIFRPSTKHKMIRTNKSSLIMSNEIAGYVDFTKFTSDLSSLGYSLEDYDDPGYVSDFYDINGKLHLSSLKKANICYNDSIKCEFVKTKYLNELTVPKKTL